MYFYRMYNEENKSLASTRIEQFLLWYSMMLCLAEFGAPVFAVVDGSLIYSLIFRASVERRERPEDLSGPNDHHGESFSQSR